MKSQIHKYLLAIHRGEALGAAILGILFSILAILLLAVCDTARRNDIKRLEIQLLELQTQNYEMMEYLLITIHNEKTD
jgi:type II secretory pathway pseudopilin PulG|tara:strand:- start:293 stop:526 length:234 start_codon:yes stop_codon:yes gene_type:complete